MKSTLCIAVMAACAIFAGPALAAGHSGSSCEAKAVDKDGRALSATAKSAFMKKCEADTKAGMPQSGGMAHTGPLPVPGGTATSGSVAPAGGVANAGGMPSAMPMANAGGMACSDHAMDKNGKPLSGAAKASHMKKCESEKGDSLSCAGRAVDKNSRALVGAAKDSFMKKCESDAMAGKK